MQIRKKWNVILEVKMYNCMEVLILFYILYIYVCVAEENVILGFVQYMYDHIIPACFIAPLKPDFDLDDGVSFMVSV